MLPASNLLLCTVRFHIAVRCHVVALCTASPSSPCLLVMAPTTLSQTHAQAGRGGALGGMMFGSASDGSTVWVADSGMDRWNQSLTNPVPNKPGQPAQGWANGGFVSALVSGEGAGGEDGWVGG